jgi:hypothetical protein
MITLMITVVSKEYERVKRWREKHRGLANLRQREYRNGRDEKPVEAPKVVAKVPTSKIEELRALVGAESAKPPVPVVMLETKPKVFRNDYGVVITEAQWNELQRRKLEAANAGYVIDEYSQ